MDIDYIIFHFVQISGEGEKLVIERSDEVDADTRVPPVGYKLYGEHKAEIANASTLPIGRTLRREDL